MAASTPIITCNYKNNYTRELVSSSNRGIISSPNPKQLANHIINLSNDLILWRRLSRNAYKFSKHHDIKNVVNKLEDFLFQLLEEHSQRHH